MTSLFSQHSQECTLRTVRNRPANWVIAALLMFQLAIGLQWQVAQAVVNPPERPMNRMEAGHCPTHPSKDSGTDEGRGAGASTSAPSPHSTPASKHDCCGSSGCQCHCAQSATALERSLVSAALSTSLLLPILDKRPPVPRASALFRPPIA
jgi:hypothetical protein